MSLHPHRKFVVVYGFTDKIIRTGQSRGQLRTDMTANEIVKAYAMFERGLMYDWCLSGGEYALSRYSALMMPMFLQGFRAAE